MKEKHTIDTCLYQIREYIKDKALDCVKNLKEATLRQISAWHKISENLDLGLVNKEGKNIL